MTASVKSSEVVGRLTPLYTCPHTKGLMSYDLCHEGCGGQMAMYRRDELLRVLTALDAEPVGRLSDSGVDAA